MTIGPGHGMAPQGHWAVRASDEDRERAVEVLKSGFVAGRLTKEEYDAHLGQVYTARHTSDLAALTSQLPGGGSALFAVIRPRTNPLATASLACGLGQFLLWPLPTIPAIVLGHVARHQMRRTGEAGSGLALAGLILGWVGAAALVLGVTIALLLLVTFGHTSHVTGG
ncbi:MAG TPA: DUF1707 and DUF4190 domain-containing protein [Streptosporangiaceae bacterium]|nr:DUF1707 and DUF4190 domain-containing protein [Streptosporangiaceae bacterium]